MTSTLVATMLAFALLFVSLGEGGRRTAPGGCHECSHTDDRRSAAMSARS
jgi:hypothetical protein